MFRTGRLHLAAVLVALAVAACASDDVARPLRTWRVEGEVRFADGRPAAGVYAYLSQRMLPGDPRGAFYSERFLTDASGAFRFAGVPSGDFALYASARGDSLAAGRSFHLDVPAAEGATTARPLALVPAATITGQARRIGETDHANIRVHLDGIPVLSGDTNGLGRWSIAGAPSGAWVLIATPLVHPPGFGHAPDTASVTVDTTGASIVAPDLELRPLSPSP